MPTKWEETKETLSKQILDAALVEFAENGYKNTTIKMIADRAGSSVGVINKYFSSKEKLLFLLMKQNNKLGEFKFDEIKELDTGEILCAYLDRIRKTQEETPSVFMLWVKVVLGNELPETSVIAIKTSFYESILNVAIVESIKNGELPSAAPFILFWTFFRSALQILDTCTYLGVEPPSHETILSIIHYQPKKDNQDKKTKSHKQ